MLSNTKQIPVDLIKLSRFTRDWSGSIDPLALAFARETGIVAPVTVRQIGNPGFPQYELLSGSGYWAIAQQLRAPTVTAVVLAGLTDADARAYIEVYDCRTTSPRHGDGVEHRQDPLAWADTALSYIEEQRGQSPRYSQRSAALALGLDPTTLSHGLRMVRKLRPTARTALRRGGISLGHAKALTAFNGAEQDQMVEKTILHQASVRIVEGAAAARRTGRAAAISCGIYRRDPELVRLEDEIAAVTGVPVSIEYDKKTKTGRVVLEFANLDVFDGILTRIGVSIEDA